MPQYEVTTTVSFTCVDIVDADGEETAKEQAEGMTFANLSRDLAYSIANADVEHELVEITSPNDEAKKYI
jgi:hypothetical protein